MPFKLLISSKPGRVLMNVDYPIMYIDLLLPIFVSFINVLIDLVNITPNYFNVFGIAYAELANEYPEPILSTNSILAN